jgi:hypothetical protein
LKATAVANRFALWDTVLMTKRNLRVVKWLGQVPAIGACTLCDRQFKVSMVALRRLQDAQQSLRVQFAEHTCNREMGNQRQEIDEDEKEVRVMPTQGESKPDLGSRQAAEYVAGAHGLLKALRDKIGEHPEIGQAIHKLETALAILEVQTGGML